MENSSKSDLEMEIGDLLFSVVNLARFLKIRPNIALFRSNEKIKERFMKVFTLAEKRGIPLSKEHINEMNVLWDEIKKAE